MISYLPALERPQKRLQTWLLLAELRAQTPCAPKARPGQAPPGCIGSAPLPLQQCHEVKARL